MFKKVFWTLVILCVLAASAGGATLYWAVVLHPGDAIKPENIRSILGKESPVFYNDGKTRLGVFFSQAHRQYVDYGAIPVNFINALVASEDNRFFSHIGFDAFGIARAALRNVQSGRIVQGGSTLTQQTAKNLFKREDRSIKAKLKELLFALRLEYHYPKEMIFEFYANQFYVSGNGHGLGVAARYYFNKKPEELSLLQCAYIAGSVKRPNAYNPFIKKTEAQRQKALKLGRARVNYVLDKMLELGMISEYQHGVATFSDMGFSQGRVGYSLDYVMEMVKDAVASEEITAALEKHNIENIATSGVRIITTVDPLVQEQSLYSLRQHLSRLDVRLRGYEREEVQKELADLNYGGDSTLTKHAFLFGTVMEVESGKAPLIHVDLGRKFGKAIIDREGLARLVTARVRWQKTPWSEAESSDFNDFLKQLEPNDKVWLSLRDRDEDGNLLADLEKFPRLNGGALVLKDGEIKAVAGGVENRFYNRAIYAQRTMGSSIKPFVFAAALQLGWNSADLLKNNRDVFIFQDQAYFPRPDHDSPFDEVSLSWAGVKSENVASVWLLAKLCDKLSSEQFWEVASFVDMAPREYDGKKERYNAFRNRIRDDFGVVVNREILGQAAFRYVQKNIETDLIFAGRESEYGSVQSMHYGLNFDLYMKNIEDEINDDEDEPSASRLKELELRQDILAHNFLDYKELNAQLQEYKRSLWDYENYFSLNPERQQVKVESDTVENPPMLFYDTFSNRYCFIRDPAASGGMRYVDRNNLRDYLRFLNINQRQMFWSNVFLEAKISVETFDMIDKQVAAETARLAEKLPYSPDVLEKVDDFRTLVGLHYLITYARELGVESELKPVLSFPLGSNVVTLFEAVSMYETLATGEVTRTGGSPDRNETLLCVIDRIESAEGQVLYRPQRNTHKVLASETSIAIGHVLENVVVHGTGRHADENIKLANTAGAVDRGFAKLDVSIPVLGKTGTANRYTNASFIGFLPTLSDSTDSLTIEDGYSIGVYVGFDDNKPMKKGRTRIAGSTGALPIWSEIVEAIVRRDNYTGQLDPVDLTFSGLKLQRPDFAQVNVGVDPGQGGIIAGRAQELGQHTRYRPSIMTFGSIDRNGAFIPDRQFSPFWRITSISEKTLTD